MSEFMPLSDKIYNILLQRQSYICMYAYVSGAALWSTIHHFIHCYCSYYKSDSIRRCIYSLHLLRNKRVWTECYCWGFSVLYHNQNQVKENISIVAVKINSLTATSFATYYSVWNLNNNNTDWSCGAVNNEINEWMVEEG